MHCKDQTLSQILLIGLLAMALSGCIVDLRPLPESIQDEVEMALDRGFDGIIVHVNQPDGMAFYTAGWNNRESQISAEAHALFKIASISKLYMAAAATMMVADGELSLDQTLEELLPEVSDRIEYSDEITLELLIQHRSGLRNYTDEQVRPWDTTITELSQMYQFILDVPAEFKPDRRYQYSNTNYFLLGEIMDKTLGYRHHHYIQDQILTPLGLTNTYHVQEHVNLDDVMSGYLVGWDPDVKDWDHWRPGGSMIATAEDVAVFVRALNDGSLFTEEEQAIYTSVYKYKHTGWLPGYTSIVEYHNDIDAVVVQFVNTSSGEMFWFDLRRVYSRVLRILEKEQKG